MSVVQTEISYRTAELSHDSAHGLDNVNRYGGQLGLTPLCTIGDHGGRTMAITADDMNADRLVANPGAIDKLNRAVIEEFRANQGKVGGAMEEMPIVLITMTGAKTGRTLTRPLCYSRDGDRIVIIASYGGAPKNPPWYHNLGRNPVVTVEVGTEKYQARAFQVSGAERRRLFEAQAKIMPFFNDYQAKTKREIPLFTLNPI
jgi:deazaflavin-dependent oxidoreductase (nitroreductase family)